MNYNSSKLVTSSTVLSNLVFIIHGELDFHIIIKKMRIYTLRFTLNLKYIVV